jgi:hypothetical protein
LLPLLHDAGEKFDSSLHYAAGRSDFPQHYAVGSQTLVQVTSNLKLNVKKMYSINQARRWVLMMGKIEVENLVLLSI